MLSIKHKPEASILQKVAKMRVLSGLLRPLAKGLASILIKKFSAM